MNALPRSYEAQVLLVPLGPSAVRLQESIRAYGLDGVMTVDTTHNEPSHNGHAPQFCSRPLAEHGWRPESSAEHISDLVTGSDMVILLASDLSQVPDTLCRQTAVAARDNGTLIAALVVGCDDWDSEDSSAMTVLREAVDMLVVVHSVSLAAPFLDVLRGGPRAANPTG